MQLGGDEEGKKRSGTCQKIRIVILQALNALLTSELPSSQDKKGSIMICIGFIT